MPRVTTVQKAQKAQGTCGKCGDKLPKGAPYRWWKFRFGGVHKRCMKPACAPKASDLTQSEFLGTLYGLQERLSEAVEGFRGSGEAGDLESELNDIASELRTLGEECQEKYDNMPEGLQQGDTGQLLENRSQECESKADELESAASDIGGFEDDPAEDADWKDYATENSLELLPDETPEAFEKRVTKAMEDERESNRDNAASDADIDLSID